MDSNWQGRGHCAGMRDPDTMFVMGKEQHRAKRICVGCEVRDHCLAAALTDRTRFGVWGGRTDRERAAILKKHRDVTDWWQYLVHDYEDQRAKVASSG